MWAAAASFLSTNWTRILMIGSAAISVMLVLFGAKQAGQNAQRVDDLKVALAIKRRQLDVKNGAPVTRDDLANKLRDGKF